MSPIPAQNGLVHVRVPTYKRPDLLLRALKSLQSQTWTDWVCDIYDDDPDAAGGEVVQALNDPRIHYTQNKPQRYASGNINACFSLSNPRDADYFCVLEDDNYLLPEFMAENIAVAREHKVNLVLRNQITEFNSHVEVPTLSVEGVLDHLFKDGIYTPEMFRLSLIMGIGISNGGLFWTRHAQSPIEITCTCTAVLQEYIRTYILTEPIYVAMKPLAVWMENEAATTRNDGDKAAYMRRELNLKRAIQMLQRAAWQQTTPQVRRGFMTNPAFATPAEGRARGLIKAHLAGPNRHVPLKDALELALRGALIRFGGKTATDFDEMVKNSTI
ncbi:glycosyltransferase family 2 protein [Asticcacaulis machinosus]|uniref:Glycosyltransferase family A protein n=1 Tax=Asticcacaulis machinosus TaxID=2984211 RepID=A0ABT5HKA0_9CAUL|nr:glycosyltransferase family A protein [Asticcacaulis machinosus]MDC7676433.1 glycosyltransferase family A protein [Asticcacaulis machinosus]